MKRREFITLLGSAAAASPLAARAQQVAMPVVGFLNPTSPDLYKRPLAAFLQGLGEAGYVDGQNVTIEYRWAKGQYERLPALVAELVQRRVAVIAATGGDITALAAKAATATIPIVFNSTTDPVARGLVASLGRPGGNLTGVTRLNAEIMPKRLELLQEAVPNVSRIAFLVNPANVSTMAIINDIEAAARSLKREIEILKASTDRDIDAAFTTLVQLRLGALLIGADPFFNSRGEQLGALTLRHAIPAMYQLHEFADGGGLMSYGSDLGDAYRLMGVFTGKILNGEKPADLPVQQSTKVQLIINLKTAKVLGLTLPLPLLGRADEVIE